MLIFVEIENDGSEGVIGKWSLPLLQSFLDYSMSFGLRRNIY